MKKIIKNNNKKKQQNKKNNIINKKIKEYKKENFFILGRVQKLLINSTIVILLNKTVVKAKFSGKIKKKSIRIFPGDLVIIETNLHDLYNNCRIIKKLYTVL